MGIWGLDIYDDDLAMDIKREFEEYLEQGMDENEALEEVIFNNDSLLEEVEECGTFILVLGVLLKENQITNSKIDKLLRELKNNKEYCNYVRDNSNDLYESRMDLLKELI